MPSNLTRSLWAKGPYQRDTIATQNILGSDGHRAVSCHIHMDAQFVCDALNAAWDKLEQTS